MECLGPDMQDTDELTDRAVRGKMMNTQIVVKREDRQPTITYLATFPSLENKTLLVPLLNVLTVDVPIITMLTYCDREDKS